MWRVLPWRPLRLPVALVATASPSAAAEDWCFHSAQRTAKNSLAVAYHTRSTTVPARKKRKRRNGTSQRPCLAHNVQCSCEILQIVEMKEWRCGKSFRCHRCLHGGRRKKRANRVKTKFRCRSSDLIGQIPFCQCLVIRPIQAFDIQRQAHDVAHLPNEDACRDGNVKLFCFSVVRGSSPARTHSKLCAIRLILQQPSIRPSCSAS